MAESAKKVVRYTIYHQRNFCDTIGEKGINPGQFEGPWGVAFNWNNDQLVVSDQVNCRLQFIDLLEKKKNVNCLGAGEGSQPGQFDYPNGLSYQPMSNNLLVCDSNNHRLQMLDEKTQVRAIIGGATGQRSTNDGQFNHPIGVDCTPNGNFFVADHWNHSIQLFDASTRFLGKFGRRGHGDKHLDRPFDVSVLDRRFSPSSAASSLLLVADNGNRRLGVWCSDGSQHISNIKLKDKPRSVCVDLDGFVCVSTEADTVKILDPRMDFDCLQTIGSCHGLGKALGYFHAPTGLCVDKTNNLFVVDTINDRIQLFV